MSRRPPEPEPRPEPPAAGGEVERRVAALERALGERDRLLEAARREAERYRALLEQASDAIVLVRPDGGVEEANRAALELLGLAPEDLPGLGLAGLIHPEELAQAPFDLESVMAGKVVRNRRRLLHRDGRAVPCETSTKRVGDRIQVIARDVSERERVSAEREELARRLELALRSARFGVWSWTPADDRFTGDARTEALFGLALPCSGAAARERMRAEDVTRLQRVPLEEVAAGSDFHEEIHLAGPPERIVSVRGRVHRDAEGALTRLTGLCWDVTETKALQEANARTRRLESIGRLAAGVAHEMNTPLQFLGDNTRFLERAVGGLCRALEEGADALPEADRAFLLREAPRALEQSREGVEQLSKIVGSMRHLAQPGGSARSRVDVAEAVEEVLALSRSEWREVAEVETRVAPDLPPVPGYPREVRQALLNLVVNAAQAVAERGEGRGRIAIEAERAGSWVVIRVRDDGPGIPEAHRPHVFDPFFTTRPPGRGTGQGLALVHDAVVEKHGGRIRLESGEGRGTTVQIELPVEEPARALGRGRARE